jgi:hypothetical protein
MGVLVFDNLAPMQDGELERAIEVHSHVFLLWAHLAIHIHDELFLATHVDAPFVDDLNPLPILK